MYKSAFVYITLDLIEKILRLKRYYTNNISKSDNNSNEAVILLFEKVNNSILVKINSLIIEINEINESNTPEELFAIQRSLSQCYLSIKDLHHELRYLNSEWLKPETYTFAEQLFEKHFMGDKKQKLNIILSDDYSFIETNLDKKFENILEFFFPEDFTYKTQETPTIIIPKIEYSNPLNWTILVHELGHIDSAEIKDLLSHPLLYPNDLNKGDREKLESWAEEIYCDIKALNIIGPAYFLSLCSFAILQSLVIGLGAASKYHPPFAIRLSLLFEYLDKNKLDIPIDDATNINSYIYSIANTINDNVNKVDKTTRQEPQIKDLMIFYQGINTELIKVERELKNLDNISELVENLKNLIPIGSHRSHFKDKEMIELLQSEN